MLKSKLKVPARLERADPDEARRELTYPAGGTSTPAPRYARTANAPLEVDCGVVLDVAAVDL